MSSSALFPLDMIKPSQILSQYSEWIYFTLVLVFFISIAGITLRKHFDKPYVKPLIISVGLLLTVGAFKLKDSLNAIFEGWGVLGTILLVSMAATIPYGLCRGFGMSGRKAFYLTYILFYILSWVKFPQMYFILADHNLGLVNLGLLVMAVVSVYKMIASAKFTEGLAHDLARSNPFRREIEQEIEIQGKEKKVLVKEAIKMTQVELHTIDDIAFALAEIQRITEKNSTGFSGQERERIGRRLEEISKKENLFKKVYTSLQGTFERVEVLDSHQLDELRQRMAKVSQKEKQILKSEIAREEEKIRIEKAVIDFQSRLDQYLYSFNRFIGSAIAKMKGPGHPVDAVPYLSKARVILRDLLDMIKKMKTVEDKLISLTTEERRLLKKEKKTT